MDKTDTTSEIQQEEMQPTKPLGELLKGYRESAHMDYDQAANTLCLTVATLQALENEQFDLLPEAPYIRGYLRGYAKLANVSSAEAIALYETIRGGTSTAANLQYNFAPSSSVNNIIKPAVSPVLLRFGILAVILLALAVISMIPDVRNWSSEIWAEFSQKTEESDTQITEQNLIEKDVTTPSDLSSALSSSSNTDTSVAQVTTPQPQENNMKGEINRQDQNGQDGSKTDTTEQKKTSTKAADTKTAPPEKANADKKVTAKDKNTPAPAENNTTATATTPATQSPPPNTNAITANGAANAVTNNGNNTTATENSAPTTETTETANADINTAAGEVSIKLVFTKKVWMRVDSKKKKVFSGLKKDGDVEEFKASKPLSFKVGNAPGVEIYINGKRYDQTPHTRGAVSRFKIEDNP